MGVTSIWKLQGPTIEHLVEVFEHVLITKTCPCNILQFFTAVKNTICRGKIVMFFLCLLKTLIVDTHNLTLIVGTHNLYFRAKIRKNCIPLLTTVLLYKSEV